MPGLSSGGQPINFRKCFINRGQYRRPPSQIKKRASRLGFAAPNSIQVTAAPIASNRYSNHRARCTPSFGMRFAVLARPIESRQVIRWTTG
jgi:hypothetical protein